MNIHFTGIGGIGMSALAQLCLEKGHNVSGSEIIGNSMTTLLESKGIDIVYQQRTENISQDIDLLIYTEAVPPNNAERIAAKSSNIDQQSYFEYLGEISKNYRTIAVAGTHGKTTTTGLLASSMINANMDPSVVVGAQLPLFGNTNYRSGKSEWLIVEACEYRENFRFIDPEIVVLTNVEVDHVDYFTSQKQYIDAYQQFITNAKIVVAHKQDPLSEKVLEGFEGTILWSDPDQTFDLALIGKHNQANSQLAAQIPEAIELSLSERKNFFEGMNQFTGSARRQEHIGTFLGRKAYDDYGHHPTEIQATYQAFVDAFPEKEILLVFEPHQYSRTAQLFNDFTNVLQNIKHVGIMPIYEARDTEKDKQSVSSEKLAQASTSTFLNNKDALESFVQNNSKKEDIVLFMGAGSISSFARELIKIKKQKN